MTQNPSHPRSSSADSSLRPKSPSMLYSILPSAVKSRLPGLPLLRRSSSTYGLTTPRIADPSHPSSGLRAPDSTLAGAMLWSSPEVEGNLYFAERGVETSEEEAIAQMDKMKYRQAMILNENRSGIGWKFASQGIYYLLLSLISCLANGC